MPLLVPYVQATLVMKPAFWSLLLPVTVSGNVIMVGLRLLFGGALNHSCCGADNACIISDCAADTPNLLRPHGVLTGPRPCE